MDHREEPLVIIRYPEGATEPEIAAFFRVAHDRARQAAEPWAVLFDLSRLRSENASASKRRVVADGALALRDDLAKHCVGIGVVTPSVFLRGLATAVLWFFTPDVPLRLFPTEASARAWLARAFTRRGDLA